MLQPIQREHESMCPNCGCVLNQMGHTEVETVSKTTIPPNLNVYLLGTALENNVSHHFSRTPQQFYEERVLKKLLDITKEYGLPDRIAYETFNVLKRNKRGFRSKKEPLREPVKQLLNILSKDENYIHVHKKRAIKVKYESILSH